MRGCTNNPRRLGHDMRNTLAAMEAAPGCCRRPRSIPRHADRGGNADSAQKLSQQIADAMRPIRVDRAARRFDAPVKNRGETHVSSQPPLMLAVPPLQCPALAHAQDKPLFGTPLSGSPIRPAISVQCAAAASPDPTSFAPIPVSQAC